MRSRYIAIAVMAFGLGGIATQYRADEAERFRRYYHTLHDENPQLSAWQRVLASLVLATSG